jgi:hypothetical protein
MLKDALFGSHYDFTEGDLNRAIIILAIPMILEMAMESLFGDCKDLAGYCSTAAVPMAMKAFVSSDESPPPLVRCIMITPVKSRVGSTHS